MLLLLLLITGLSITSNIVKTINHIQQLLIKQSIHLQHLYSLFVQHSSTFITCSTIINKVSTG